jgi:hypothetical protein
MIEEGTFMSQGAYRRDALTHTGLWIDFLLDLVLPGGLHANALERAT